MNEYYTIILWVNFLKSVDVYSTKYANQIKINDYDMILAAWQITIYDEV